ncbi:MAG TPA: hypothetical protein VFU94_10405 [Conexibacter sp.]|nr:hypothetical protein [Conexibacter sp.]
MPTWDDVRRLALALPETDEHVSRGNSHWRVRAGARAETARSRVPRRARLRTRPPG